VLDETMVCPLCNGVIEVDEDKMQDSEQFISKSVMYPDVTPQVRKIKFIMKLVVFASVFISGVLILINYLTSWKVKWSLICCVGIIYMCFSAVYYYEHNASHRTKIMTESIAMIAGTVLLDFAIGYSGWSVNFAIPCNIMLLVAGIIAFMFIDIENWQSYILLETYVVVISGLASIMLFTKTITHPLLMIIADGVAVLLLVGTLVIGGRRATTELKRRFHV